SGGNAVMTHTGGANNLGVNFATAVATPQTNEFVPQYLLDGGTTNTNDASLVHVVDGNFVVGAYQFGNGTYNQSGTAANNIGGNIIVGMSSGSGPGSGGASNSTGAQGVFNQSGGVTKVGLSTGGGGANPGGDVV